MDLIQKKQKMCNILLNSPHDYDLIIYKLLKTDILDEIILKLDNKIVCCNANPSEIYSAEEQFLMLLTRLFDFLLKIFPSLYKAREVVMEDIINGNKQNVEKYLLSKHYVGDNKYINFFKKNNYKIIFGNFINNIQEMSEVKNILKRENIKIKQISEYSVIELCDIANFFKKIGICNLDDEFVLTYIFSNINTVVEKRKKSKKFNIDYEVEKKKGIYYFDNIYYRTVEFYQFQYLSLIDDYIKMKKMINNC